MGQKLTQPNLTIASSVEPEDLGPLYPLLASKTGSHPLATSYSLGSLSVLLSQKLLHYSTTTHPLFNQLPAAAPSPSRNLGSRLPDKNLLNVNQAFSIFIFGSV